MAKRRGESVMLRCARCSWSTELALQATSESVVIACAHCSEPMYWNRCDGCGLCYLGEATPHCPSCDDASLDTLEYV